MYHFKNLIKSQLKSPVSPYNQKLFKIPQYNFINIPTSIKKPKAKEFTNEQFIFKHNSREELEEISISINQILFKQLNNFQKLKNNITHIKENQNPAVTINIIMGAFMATLGGLFSLYRHNKKSRQIRQS